MNYKKIFTLGIFLLAIFFPVSPALAVNIQNPAGEYFITVGGDGSFATIIVYIITRILLPLTGLVSLIFIIIGGFRYITSAGNDEAAESGKKMVTNAVIGMIIVIVSYVIITVVYNALKSGLS